MSKTRTTLNKKLLMVILPLNIISLIVVGIVCYSMASKNIKTRASEYMQQYLVQLTRTIDNELNTSIQVNAQLAVNAQVIETLKKYEGAASVEKVAYREKMTELFTSLNSIYGNIKGIYIFDNCENEFYARNRYGQNFDEMKQTDWYQKTLENQGAYVLFLDDKSGAEIRHQDMTLGIARSVVDIYTKETYGVVLTEISYSTLEDSVYGENRQLNLEHGNIYIRDEQGNLIYATSSDVDVQENMQWSTEEAESDFVRIQKIDGKEVIDISYQSEESEWIYTYQCEMKYLMQDMENLKMIIAIYILGMSLVVVMVSVIFSRWFLKPLRDLVQGMKALTKGNYDVQIQTNTQDEFRYVIQKFNDMVRNIKELIQKVYQADIIQREAELEILQQQINPHFLYNTLESMRGLALEENCGKVADMAKNMSDFMRYNMHRSHKAANLADEERHISCYVRLINYRFNNKIYLKLEIPEQMRKLPIPKFTLQPIVENAVLHGLSEKKENCEIIISGCMDGEVATIYVRDNGVGIAEKALDEINRYLIQNIEILREQSQKRSIGIYNVNSRLKLKYGDKYGIKLDSEEGKGTTVEIRIPVTKEGYYEGSDCR